MQTKVSSCSRQFPLLGRGLVIGLEPANAVRSVAANVSRIAVRSSDLICGKDVKVVGTDVEVEEWEFRKDVICEVFDPAKTNLAAL